MRIVTGPENVIDPDDIAIPNPDHIVDEGRKDLAVEIEARLFDQFGLRMMAVLFPDQIHPGN